LGKQPKKRAQVSAQPAAALSHGAGQRPLPDRVCSTDPKKQVMITWVNEMLDRFKSDGEPCSLEKAVERADKEGNIEPLRQALLRQTGYDLDRFLRKKPAGRKRGQHYPIVKKKDPVTEAAIDAKIIWWLWKRNFPKLPTGVNAKQIAADRHKVSDDEVINKSKKISFEISPSNKDFGARGFLRFPRRQKPILFWWDADF
jgi:hypothetical protein